MIGLKVQNSEFPVHGTLKPGTIAAILDSDD